MTSPPTSIRDARASRHIADVLDGAYDIIDTEGWLSGPEANLGSRVDGPCCVAVAIARSCRQQNLTRWFMPAFRAMERHVGGSLVQFNDASPSATRVLRALEQVADVHRIRSEGAS